MRSSDPHKTQWILSVEDYARRHPQDEYTAAELALRIEPPQALRRKCEQRSLGQSLAKFLRDRKDTLGHRMNGSYLSGDRHIWKPLDSMTAAQLRETWSRRVKSQVVDIYQLNTDFDRFNELLTARGAKPLDDSWRDELKAVVDGATAAYA